MMSNWNEVYTLDRQKQMTKEAQEKDKNIKTNVMYKAPHHDIYATQHDFLTPSIRREQERKDKFAWKVGIFALTLVTMAGIAGIWWAVTL